MRQKGERPKGKVKRSDTADSKTTGKRTLDEYKMRESSKILIIVTVWIMFSDHVSALSCRLISFSAVFPLLSFSQINSVGTTENKESPRWNRKNCEVIDGKNTNKKRYASIVYIISSQKLSINTETSASAEQFSAHLSQFFITVFYSAAKEKWIWVMATFAVEGILNSQSLKRENSTDKEWALVIVIHARTDFLNTSEY